MNEYDLIAFGKFFLEVREANGLSRAKVAEALGLKSQSSVMNFERGFTEIRLSYLSKFVHLIPDMTLPVYMAMYEAGSAKRPCYCICHQDLGRTLSIYSAKIKRCNLCGHSQGDCTLIRGLWFEI